MGTRNLTCVVTGGEYKVAQYGQWDGYPSGQGLTALRFLRDADLTCLKQKAEAARWISADEIEALNQTNWKITHPQLSRDHGAKILGMISDSEDGIVLLDSLNFAADSLMCEWAYVIDLDKKTFEAFKGFNEAGPVSEDERFAFLNDKAERGYYPVKHVHTFSLDALPGDADFLSILEPDEEEDDA